MTETDNDSSQSPGPSQKKPSKLGCYLAPVVLFLMALMATFLVQREATEKDFRQARADILRGIAQPALNAARDALLRQWQEGANPQRLAAFEDQGGMNDRGETFSDSRGLVSYRRLTVRLPDPGSESPDPVTMLDLTILLLRGWDSGETQVYVLDHGARTKPQAALLQTLRERLAAAGAKVHERSIPDFEPRKCWDLVQDSDGRQ